jgi:hypothetical protein
MFQVIKKIFSLRQAQDGKKKSNKVNKSWDKKSVFAKSYDGTKQLREMGKLGGKLILM